MHERERLALEMLGTDRLTIRELYGRMKPRVPADASFHESDIRPLVARLYKAGQLDRQGERYRKGNSVRYRYFRLASAPPVANGLQTSSR